MHLCDQLDQVFLDIKLGFIVESFLEDELPDVLVVLEELNGPGTIPEDLDDFCDIEFKKNVLCVVESHCIMKNTIALHELEILLG